MNLSTEQKPRMIKNAITHHTFTITSITFLVSSSYMKWEMFRSAAMTSTRME